MKTRLLTLTLAFIVCALAAPAALANVKTKSVTFITDVKVGDTLVKKGSYKAKFDEQSGELTIMDSKKNVVAKAAARLETLPSEVRNKAVTYRTSNDGAGNLSLLSLNMGSKFAVIGANSTAGTPAPTTSRP